MFGHIADSAHLTSGVLFLDLTTAFHRLVREWVSGIHIEADIIQVLDAMEAEGLSIGEMCERLHLPSLLERLNAPPFLVHLLRDIHSHTWMTIGKTPEFATTKRGTRPGSPIADCIFHVLMAEILCQLQAWIDAQDDFQAILREFDIPGGFIAWADDLAIPWIVRSAVDLPPAIRSVLTFVSQLFAKFGFLLNLDKGKTSAVVTFRGPGAPLLRKQFQLGAKPGDLLQIDGREVFLHYATSAFGQIARPILCNRHLPEQTRVQLFQTLICTKLLFGLGAWETPTLRQFHKLRAVLLRMLHRVLRLKPTEIQTTTAAAIFHRAGFPDLRVKLAVDRLLYAQRLWQHGPPELQHLAHREHSLCSNSWLEGLLADLKWMQQLEVGFVFEPVIDVSDLTSLFDFWQSGSPDWAKRVKRVLRRHQRQEAMMHKLHRLHGQFFSILKESATFRPNGVLEGGADLEQDFGCFCGRTFTTAQGLAAHKRLAHDVRALESHLIDGATRLCCLKFLWSRQRLYQHLAYIPRKGQINFCFQELQKRGFHVMPDLPTTGARRPSGLHRTEALQALGPHQQPLDSRSSALEAAQAQLSALELELVIDAVPDDAEAWQDRICHQLTLRTQTWFHDFCALGYDAGCISQLPDSWLAVVEDVPQTFDMWLEAVFILWGEHFLSEVLDTFVDGEAERLVDDAFAEMIYDFPRMQLLTDIAFLQQKVSRLEVAQTLYFPHRPPRVGTANERERTATAMHITSLFLEQSDWLSRVRLVQFDVIPTADRIPCSVENISDVPLFLVVHLFSGRRRSTDLHAYLEAFGTDLEFRVHVLSLDTAISYHHGNLQLGSTTWERVMSLYSSGRVSATVCGAPCETFSEARHHVPEPTDGDTGRKWPRPLRSALRFFGLDALTFRELKQTAQGSEFFMQGLLTAAWSLRFGSIYLSEHPWKPEDETRVSVWTSPWVQLLLQLPQAHLHRVCQWRWGAETSKPTGILALNCPHFAASVYSRQTPNIEKPDRIAIGCDARTGRFRTAVLKEYPPDFSRALAGAIADRFVYMKRHRLLLETPLADPVVEAWLCEVLRCCNVIRADAPCLPDYQG
eukprot:s1362_g21.t1